MMYEGRARSCQAQGHRASSVRVLWFVVQTQTIVEEYKDNCGRSETRY
jgi:hypothetical protein